MVLKDGGGAVKISIHAAQEGCDFNVFSFIKLVKIFQSTQPKRAATPVLWAKSRRIYQFQSTQPKRAATDFNNAYTGVQNNFNPRSPRGLRRNADYFMQKMEAISIHAAQEGCDPI